MQKATFLKTIWEFYQKNARDLPWRKTTDPYKILASEVMLQQTQVSRVLVKYPQFIEHFPTFRSLVKAPLREILSVWQGMGYSRRALYLKKIAEIIIEKYKGQLPTDPKILKKFPGIGTATAGSIIAFIYNLPTVFIETNIRRTFIHHFFHDKTNVDDREIIPLVERTLDKVNPREWYYALMDYGAMLTEKVDNPNRKSKHYAVQSSFIGSDRQLRGKILKLLLNGRELNEKKILDLINEDKKRVRRIVAGLQKEGLIREEKGHYLIS